MKGKFFRQLFMAAAVPATLLSVSCVREHLPEGSGVTAGIEILVDGDFRDTRSAVGPESSLDGYESAAKDMTVFQFGKSSGGGYVLERTYHFNLKGGAAPKVSGVSGRNYRSMPFSTAETFRHASLGVTGKVSSRGLPCPVLRRSSPLRRVCPWHAARWTLLWEQPSRCVSRGSLPVTTSEWSRTSRTERSALGACA